MIILRKKKYFKFLLNGINSETFKNNDSFIKQFQSKKYNGVFNWNIFSFDEKFQSLVVLIIINTAVSTKQFLELFFIALELFFMNFRVSFTSKNLNNFINLKMLRKKNQKKLKQKKI